MSAVAAAIDTDGLDRSDRWPRHSTKVTEINYSLPDFVASAITDPEGELSSRFSNTLLNSLAAFFESELKRVEEVRDVRLTSRMQNERRVIHVWTSLSKDDRAIRYRVYEIEERLMAHFEEELFDFHLHLEGDNLPGGKVPVYPPTDAEQG